MVLFLYTSMWWLNLHKRGIADRGRKSELAAEVWDRFVSPLQSKILPYNLDTLSHCNLNISSSVLIKPYLSLNFKVSYLLCVHAYATMFVLYDKNMDEDGLVFYTIYHRVNPFSTLDHGRYLSDLFLDNLSTKLIHVYNLLQHTFCTISSSVGLLFLLGVTIGRVGLNLNEL